MDVNLSKVKAETGGAKEKQSSASTFITLFQFFHLASLPLFIVFFQFHHEVNNFSKNHMLSFRKLLLIKIEKLTKNSKIQTSIPKNFDTVYTESFEGILETAQGNVTLDSF